MREQDADVAERAEVQKVAIARNDDRCVGANGAGKHMIVVRIARGRANGNWPHECDEGAVADEQLRNRAANLGNA